MNKILLGKGLLSWNAQERRSDRYGHIGLYDSDCEDEKGTNDFKYEMDNIKRLESKIGKIEVVVIEPRESKHLGDIFRGFFPSMPEKNETHILGEGSFFSIEDYGLKLGIKPNDGRSSDWLNPESLYRCHESFVEVYFIPSK